MNARAEPQNWLMYWGDYRGTNYSPLTQIDRGNVSRLAPAWSFPIPEGGESVPLVADGVMYVPGGRRVRTVTALDAWAGRQLWSWERQQRVSPPEGVYIANRGLALAGQRLFVGTADAALVCLDARTGRQLWEVQVADPLEGYSITNAPLVVKDKILVGHAGAEFPIRGFLDAYDFTGKRLWRFHTIPGPGEFGNDTWKGDSWRTGGGSTWLPGTYDPELDTVYWPVANPAPSADRSVRGDGDNLFTNSVVALDPDTGQRKWRYQFTPNDGRDWDSTQDVMLVDRVWQGQQRKLLLHADRNGHFYVLDRTNGKFLQATPFVYQNWNTGFDANGRNLPVPGSNSSPEGSFFVYPHSVGGTNYQSPSYSPRTGLFYLQYSERGGQFASAPGVPEMGRRYIGGGKALTPAVRQPNEPEPSIGVKALDVATGKTVWDFRFDTWPTLNGVLATAGNVLFVSGRDGRLIALDAASGKHLRHHSIGRPGSGQISPMSYAIDGRQYVAMSYAGTLHAFALPTPVR